MAKTLSSKTTTDIAAPVTKPTLLVAVGWSTPKYLSSTGAVTWNSISWEAADVVVGNIQPDKNTATVKIGNTNFAFGQLVLTNGIDGVLIAVYQLYGDAPHADGDGYCLVFGSGGRCEVGTRWVSIDVGPPKLAKVMRPGVVISVDNGFNWLPPDGSTVSWDGEIFVLEREGI